jgi:predicted adenylyl cyclase CyaB
VKKVRRLYHLKAGEHALEACLDTVERVGTFAELEIQAPESGLEPARHQLLATAAALGLQQSERRSYLELLLEASKQP